MQTLVSGQFRIFHLLRRVDYAADADRPNHFGNFCVVQQDFKQPQQTPRVHHDVKQAAMKQCCEDFMKEK